MERDLERDFEKGFELRPASQPHARIVLRPITGAELWEIIRSNGDDGPTLYRCVRRCVVEWHDVVLMSEQPSTHCPEKGIIAAPHDWELMNPVIITEMLKAAQDRVKPTDAERKNSSSPPSTANSGSTSPAAALAGVPAAIPPSDESKSTTTRALTNGDAPSEF